MHESCVRLWNENFVCAKSTIFLIWRWVHRLEGQIKEDEMDGNVYARERLVSESLAYGDCHARWAGFETGRSAVVGMRGLVVWMRTRD